MPADEKTDPLAHRFARAVAAVRAASDPSEPRFSLADIDLVNSVPATSRFKLASNLQKKLQETPANRRAGPLCRLSLAHAKAGNMKLPAPTLALGRPVSRRPPKSDALVAFPPCQCFAVVARIFDHCQRDSRAL